MDLTTVCFNERLFSFGVSFTVNRTVDEDVKHSYIVTIESNGAACAQKQYLLLDAQRKMKKSNLGAIL